MIDLNNLGEPAPESANNAKRREVSAELIRLLDQDLQAHLAWARKES
jgi:hypothetical protein